jgi:ectoine hydroxylase-related dioxygenase (phytanoyl-CoA dioxygenase family)
MYEVQRAIRDDVGTDRLWRAGELGILRVTMKYDPRFVRLLEIPEVLEFVDATVSPTAIMHLQNGFILPSYPPSEYPNVFQSRFHQDFPRVLNGYLLSVNVLLCIDQFSKQQIDYVRALGDEFVQSFVPRTQQLLGWYTRVPASLDEYYQPPDKRLYRSGQG